MRIWIEGNAETNQFLRKKCTENGMVLSTPSACDLAVLQFQIGRAHV